MGSSPGDKAAEA